MSGDIPTIAQVMQRSRAHLEAARRGDDLAVIAAALLWLIEMNSGSGYCWELRKRLEEIALRAADDEATETASLPVPNDQRGPSSSKSSSQD